MAQQTDTEWTDAQNAAELEAGDSVRVVNERTGSAVLDTARVTDALEGVGTVQVRTATGRTKEVRFQEDGSVKVRGDCFTYTLQVEREVATDGGQQQADPSEAEQQALAPGEVDEGDDVVVYYENRASHGVHTERLHVTDVEDDGTLRVECDRGSTGRGSVQPGYVDGYGNEVGSPDEWLTWDLEKTEARARAERSSTVQQGSVVRVVSEARHEWEQEQAPLFCMDCQEFQDHGTPVECSHSSTGRTGCPECLEADPLRRVVHEVGDGRTVTYGHISEGQQDHGHCLTLEAAEAIAQD